MPIGNGVTRNKPRENSKRDEQCDDSRQLKEVHHDGAPLPVSCAMVSKMRRTTAGRRPASRPVRAGRPRRPVARRPVARRPVGRARRELAGRRRRCGRHRATSRGAPPLLWRAGRRAAARRPEVARAGGGDEAGQRGGRGVRLGRGDVGVQHRERAGGRYARAREALHAPAAVRQDDASRWEGRVHRALHVRPGFRPARTHDPGESRGVALRQARFLAESAQEGRHHQAARGGDAGGEAIDRNDRRGDGRDPELGGLVEAGVRVEGGGVGGRRIVTIRIGDY